jgi:hypothetical protein
VQLKPNNRLPTQPSIQLRMQLGSIDGMELDASMLRPIVGHALDAVVALPVEWSVVPILVGDGQGLGVSRVSGSAASVVSRAWSLILKVLPRAPGSPTEWNYPAREALAYERGLLAGRGCRRGARASSLRRAPARPAGVSAPGPRSPATAVGASSTAPRRAGPTAPGARP